MKNIAKTQPPQAKKIPHRTEIHGDTLIDDYFWIREKTSPEVMDHLKAENAYSESILAQTGDTRARLFEEMKARIKEDDAEVPYRKGEYFYYSRMEPGKQYAIRCRKRGSLTASEEIILDDNLLADGQKYFSLGIFDVSPDHNWLAYAVDLDGSEKYTIHFKNLLTGALSPESIPGAATSLEWANDNKTVFYTMLDEHERPDRMLRHVIGEEPAKDSLIYKEADSQMFVYCGKSRSERFIFLELQGKVTSEILFIEASQPLQTFKMVEPRRRDILYSITHHEDLFFIVTNDTVKNFRLVSAPVDAPQAANWKEVRAGSSAVFIEDAHAFRSYLVLDERQNGLRQLRIVDLKTKDYANHLIEFPEPAYNLSPLANPEFDSETFRFAYTSMVTPSTVFDYNLRTRAMEIKKTQEIPSGYDKTKYKSERLFAISYDGTRVPISIVYRLDTSSGFKRDGSHPLFLYGYGAYGSSMSPSFSVSRLSLLDRGFVYAIAHIRGGAEMGRQWYEDGKFLNKKNTFLDFIASAEFLIKEGFTRKGEIAAVGGSAGGMLIGSILNMRPDLFKAAIAQVPFVDVVNTMLDETLPLTTLEFEEWGNPKDLVYYNYIKSYSPYENVARQAYPNLLVTSGLHDPRVTYWEPAKWVAKLRELKTDDNLILQHINMEAGHGGPSGRYEALKEIAMEYAFLFLVFGIQAF